VRATLEFNLDEQEDVMAHRRAVLALDMALALWEFDNEVLRPVVKYGTDEAVCKVYEEVRRRFHEILGDRGIDLGTLMS
jgi:hypothetical protein